MPKYTISRAEIKKFLKCWEWRVDELFECGAILETPDGVYSKLLLAEAFREESYIKGIAQRPKPRRELVPRDMTQSVYFIEDGDAIKIGIGMNPEIRMVGLQVGNPRPLRMLASYRASRSEEAALHRRFAPYLIQGEWFRDNPELRALIATKSPANDNQIATEAKTA